MSMPQIAMSQSRTGLTKEIVYPTIRHMAMCTENNRRLARLYRLIFGMDEVPSLREVEQRIKKPLGLTYPGEPALEMPQPADGPYKVTRLKDPDGNQLDISEEGWPLLDL